ncbi:spore germination protein [Paenibacillus sp. M1]|uniref:Spore germination protein n=1 Tax=Paenibacillus haidiansis TaxID=1574488 RepID=A0ABU7VSF8_9BACL
MRRKFIGPFLRPLLKNKHPDSRREDRESKNLPPSEPCLQQSLVENLALLQKIFDHCEDVIFREFTIGEQQARAAIIWLDGTVDRQLIDDIVLQSLMQEARKLPPNGDISPPQLHTLIRDSLLSTTSIVESYKIPDLVDRVLTGFCAILIDGVEVSIVASVRGEQMRSVTEPETEAVVRGPRQGFTENIRVGSALIRRIIKTPDLKLETRKLGRLTKTDVAILYIQGIADEKVIQEVRQRLGRIQVDSILESAYIEELIEDQPFSPFPQIAHTERPDKAAAELLEGRVVILIDGTPFALIVPTLFVQFLQSSEDYYERYFFAFLIRSVRFLFLLIALSLPSIYIAATTYHQEMLPTPLLISIAGARQGVPFPAFLEALLMEVAFEALREAGVRLPKTVGQAVSIVGALVIGEAAVRAGIVSSAMVIIVSLTAIASFAIPAFNLAITVRMLRFPLMILAAVFGFYGIMLGYLALLIHICSLRSFGVPYLTPISPFKRQGMKDVLFRAPWWRMNNRPGGISPNNRQRQNTPRPGPKS